jgi:cyclophilin family peptidyl-prolyl cis-trans isomerase
MAHAGPNTGGSQFFICNGSAPSHLDGVHTVFGQCASDADIKVVQAIKANDRIVKATVVEA